MVVQDKNYGLAYLTQIVNHHTSGQLKIAPEHISPAVLKLMAKPGPDYLLDFKREFDRLSRIAGKKQFLTYYFIAAHPGCEYEQMRDLRRFVITKLRILPEQVQIFTPIPSTDSALMYYTETDPATGNKIYVEKNLRAKTRQKEALVYHPNTNGVK